DHDLLELPDIEARLALRQGSLEPEGVGGGDPVDEGRPGDRCGPGLGQLRKLCVTLYEGGEVRCPVADGGEYLCELRVVRLEQGARVSERADRGEGVVELVRDDANDLLPDDYFLRGELARELLEQQQLVRLAIEDEAAPREMVDLRLTRDLHREQRIA